MHEDSKHGHQEADLNNGEQSDESSGDDSQNNSQVGDAWVRDVFVLENIEFYLLIITRD